MINVSKKFKKAVYAPSRHCKAKVRFEILDTTAFIDNVKTVSTEAITSRKEQLTNKVRNMSSRYAVFEKDYFKLDGSFILPDLAGDYEYGWWSNSLCDNEGNFGPYETVEFTFSEEHSSMGLTIYFDTLNDEYATDFDIDVYDNLDEVIKHEGVEGNSSSRYIFINQLKDYSRILITIKKWCKGYHRAKIVEVDFGIIKEYIDDNLINVNLTREINTTSEAIPAGELEFTIDNSLKEFNVLNPKGFYEFLQQGQECFTEIGVETEKGIEYVQSGKHYLRGWQSDEGTLTASFTARDVIDNLSGDEIENSITRSISLYDLAEEVMVASEIESYVLSNNLKLITSKGLYSKISYRNLLQLIAQAGMCVVYVDNKDTLYMKQLISAETVIGSISVSNQEDISYKDQVINNIVEPTYNLASFEKDRIKLDGSFNVPSNDNGEVGWWSDDLCNEYGVFSAPLMLEIITFKDHASINFEILFDILNNEYASEFELRAYDIDDTLIIDETIVNNSSGCFYQNNMLSNSRKIEIVISRWSKPYRRARIVEIGFDLPVDNITFDNIYKEPQIKLEQAIKAVEVTYYPNDLENGLTYTAVNQNVKNGEIIKIENSLINTESDAQNVAEWILAESIKIANFDIDWRGNPAIELADKVSIESGYNTNSMVNITKIELEYEGSLKGNIEGKGVI